MVILWKLNNLAPRFKILYNKKNILNSRKGKKMDIQIRKIEDSINSEMINAVKQINIADAEHTPDIKGLSKSESQSYWKYILVHAIYIYHKQEFSQHIGVHLAVTLLGACEIELYSAIDKMNKSCKYIPV